MSKFFYINLIALSCLFCLSISTESFADNNFLTLEKSYELALKQSEVLRQKEAEVKEAQARYQEALSYIWPKIYSVTQQRYRNDENFGRTRVVGDISTPGDTFPAQSDRPFDSTINIRQPLFTGFREWYLADAQEDNIKALKLSRKRQEQLLYEDLANVFNQVVFYEKDLKILNETEDVFKQRITELNEFIELGRSRVSERNAAELDLAQTAAIKAQVNGLFEASQELLAFLVGKDAQDITAAWEPEKKIFTQLSGLVENAKTRLDVRATESKILQTQKELVATKRESWPQLTLDGNYYTYEAPELNRDWEVLLRLEIPLYLAGEIDARINQAEERMKIAELEKQRTERVAEREIRTAYRYYLNTKNEITELDKAVKAANKNYQAQRKDYEVGVVTNLEVLNAIANYQQSQRRLLEAQARQRTNLARLLVASGEI